MNTESIDSHRFILAHKQATSARVRFLRLPGGILAPTPLPADSRLQAPDDSPAPENTTILTRGMEMGLGIPLASLEPAEDFHIRAQTPAGEISILLAAFVGIDPPFAAAENLGGRFIALTEARSLPDVERELLRRAYEYLLG